MVRVVMFDVGGTLLDAAGQPYPHALAAVAAIQGLHVAGGKPLASCLVSDYTLCPKPITAAKVKPLFEQYLARIAPLRPAFEPVARRVTLSTHAGVMKPERAVFEKALARLKSSAALADCLLITENAAHVRAARKELGMQALQFGADFDDWSQAPALVAHRIDPADAANAEVAARAFLAARGVEACQLVPTRAAGRWTAQGQAWHAVQLDGPGTVHVAVPVAVALTRARDGAFAAEVAAPSAEDLAEARAYAESLAAHGQIAADGAAGRGATHAIETDGEGRRRLVRKRFSAL